MTRMHELSFAIARLESQLREMEAMTDALRTAIAELKKAQLEILRAEPPPSKKAG